jgi:plasmid stabilization system protein ParE
MRRLIYRPAALDDLLNIQDYIARDNPARAVSFTELRQQCLNLASLPGTLGRPRDELRSGIRSFAYRGYVILFRYETDAVEVVHVFEGHRDINSLVGGA